MVRETSVMETNAIEKQMEGDRTKRGDRDTNKEMKSEQERERERDFFFVCVKEGIDRHNERSICLHEYGIFHFISFHFNTDHLLQPMAVKEELRDEE